MLLKRLTRKNFIPERPGIPSLAQQNTNTASSIILPLQFIRTYSLNRWFPRSKIYQHTSRNACSSI